MGQALFSVGQNQRCFIHFGYCLCIYQNSLAYFNLFNRKSMYRYNSDVYGRGLEPKNGNNHPVRRGINWVSLSHRQRKNVMFNIVGICCLMLYMYLRMYDWIILRIEFADWKEFVLLSLSSMFLFIKGIRGLIQLRHYNKKLKQEEELKQIEIEERRQGIHLGQAKGRREDYDDNQITD